MTRLYIFAIIMVASLSCVRDKGAKPAIQPEVAGRIIKLHSPSRDTISLGRLSSGEIAEQRLEIMNNDTVPVVILDISTDCGCTTTSYDKHPVKPGETSSITLRFDSKGESGTQFKSLRILTSRSPEPVTVYFTAEVMR